MKAGVDMNAVTGLTVLLVFQAIGEVLARTGAVPILPGPLVGLLLLLPLLSWAPAREPVAGAAGPLLAHLSLLFVPVGVGVMEHLGLIGQFGLRMLATVTLSTWIGMAVTALVLRALLKPRS